MENKAPDNVPAHIDTKFIYNREMILELHVWTQVYYFVH